MPFPPSGSVTVNTAIDPHDATSRMRVVTASANAVVQLFDPGTVPESAPMSVTQWDFAFLKALYASSNQVAASQQRNEIGRKMAEELANVPADER